MLTTSVRATGGTALLSSHVITDIEEACEHIVVLGAGRKLLDTTIDDAKASHRVLPAGDEADGLGLVGSFLGPDGSRLSLIRNGPGGPAGSAASASAASAPATLEDIVLGYLASARTPPVMPGPKQ